MTVYKSSRDSVKHSAVVVQHNSIDGSNITSTQSFPIAWVNDVTRQDNIPNWRGRIELGLNASTWYDGKSFRARVLPSVGTYRQRFLSGNVRTYTATGDVISMCYQPTELLWPSALDIEKARTQAEIAFTKNFRNRTRHWQSGVFAGELFQVARMLASPVKALRKGVDDLYKSLFQNTRKAARGQGRQRARAIKDAVAGTYLEWQYAVKPTISDCNDAAKAFRAMASARTFDMIRLIGEGASTRNEVRLRSFNYNSGWSGGGYQEEHLTYHVDVILRGAWRSDKVDSTLPLPMQFGLDLGSLLPTAWELVPWSFIADYFSNMGEVLDAWGMRFIDFAWLNETVRLRSSIKSIPPPGFQMNVSGNPYELYFKTTAQPTLHVRSRTYRVPYDNSWTPRIQAEMPGLGSQKWLNMLALASMRKVPSHLSRLG